LRSLEPIEGVLVDYLALKKLPPQFSGHVCNKIIFSHFITPLISLKYLLNDKLFGVGQDQIAGCLQQRGLSIKQPGIGEELERGGVVAGEFSAAQAVDSRPRISWPRSSAPSHPMSRR
jgi:hypothetical protein